MLRPDQSLLHVWQFNNSAVASFFWANNVMLNRSVIVNENESSHHGCANSNISTGVTELFFNQAGIREEARRVW